jgi:threonine synthase
MFFCSSCTRFYDTAKPRWRCDCGAYLLYRNHARFPVEQLEHRAKSIWRYREMLGIDSTECVTLGEGLTPLQPAMLFGRNVLLKLDYLCPSGSYKDRGGATLLTKLKEWGVSEIIEDSSGNAGASIAAYSAVAGIRSRVFVPSSTSSGKTAQIAMYGAEVVKVSGSREDTACAARAAAEDGAFYASHNWSPHFLLGMKTVAYEIAEQLNWRVPDWLIIPVGGGSLLAGAWLGFQDLAAAGVISRPPRLVAVQSAACAPVYYAWKAGLNEISAVSKQETAAEGIAVARPVRDRLVLEALRQSDGVVCRVTDEDLWSMLETLGRMGVYVEPTSAAAPAALEGLLEDGTIASGDTVAILLTGSGLKATDKIVQHSMARDAAELEALQA